MTAEESKMTAQEMFEQYYEREDGTSADTTYGVDYYKSGCQQAYLSAHSAQQKVIDEYKEMLELQGEAMVAQLARIDEQAEKIKALDEMYSELYEHHEKYAKHVTESLDKVDEQAKDLGFAYKRAKVLADLCGIPVHESPEVTGTILGLVRGHVERLKATVDEQAGEIERLRTALKPFANYACELQPNETCNCHNCTARQALEKTPNQQKGETK